MINLMVAMSPGVDVSPADLVTAWEGDEEARALGTATADVPPSGVFLPDVLTLVVIPLLVNVSSSVTIAVVRRRVTKLRSARSKNPDLELVEIENSVGDRILIVRLRGDNQ